VAKPGVTRPFLCCWRLQADKPALSDNFRSEIWRSHHISRKCNLSFWRYCDVSAATPQDYQKWPIPRAVASLKETEGHILQGGTVIKVALSLDNFSYLNITQCRGRTL